MIGIAILEGAVLIYCSNKGNETNRRVAHPRTGHVRICRKDEHFLVSVF
ncbi:hypothetical protein CLOBOL_06777 [Enterocloster bolteae ATCC BAA-613]|uniref:Uncharacterized protein n=1 Tax=Enterocloster bolteae (strain ATCC BAA-613 / DSM 15670 / CCUG 46953 / JCM 12243 / WAL 16351) TaxID=411902 RepID=A8S402_ENTBW|nr:hypothetical protein CLOBOL_06777 [Enterocloster bolteae ATCC BAA-613]